MKQLKIEPTHSTPAVIFNKSDGVLQMAGNCYPTNVISFFDPLLFWIQSYVQDPDPVTRFEFRLKYISSSSLKQLLVLMKSFTPLNEVYQMTVDWYHHPEDEDMKERGEFLAEMTGMKFNFISE